VGRGVAGRSFPFTFWPLVWGGAVGFGASAYLHSDEVIAFLFFAPSWQLNPLISTVGLTTAVVLEDQ
jgi:hypothetical protein